jgi:hypothetical protein
MLILTVHGTRFETRTSPIRSRISNHTATPEPTICVWVRRIFNDYVTTVETQVLRRIKWSIQNINIDIYNEELCGLHCSPWIVRALKCRRLQWAGHTARIGEIRDVRRILVVKRLKKFNLEDQENGSITLRRTLGRLAEGMGDGWN